MIVRASVSFVIPLQGRCRPKAPLDRFSSRAELGE